MSLLSDIKKYVKTHHMIALLGALIAGIAIYQYAERKSRTTDAFSVANPNADMGLPGAPGLDLEDEEKRRAFYATASGDSASVPEGQSSGDQYASVESGADGLAPACAGGNPGDLLPKAHSGDFSHVAPQEGGINLLKAGHHAGIDTVGGSLRNANLQVRSEPPNPTDMVSPWNQTTMTPDLMRVPLEIGCGPQ